METQNILFYILLYFLISCSNIKPLQKPTEANTKEANKGIVFLEFGKIISAGGPANITREGNIILIRFCHSKKDICYEVESNQDKINQDKIMSFMVEEGYYSTDFIKSKSKLVIIVSKYDKKNFKSELAGFEIKAGEKINLGKISAIMIRSPYWKDLYNTPSFFLQIESNHSNLVSDIQANYPFIDINSIQYKPLETGTQSSILPKEIIEKYDIDF